MNQLIYAEDSSRIRGMFWLNSSTQPVASGKRAGLQARGGERRLSGRPTSVLFDLTLPEIQITCSAPRLLTPPARPCRPPADLGLALTGGLAAAYYELQKMQMDVLIRGGTGPLSQIPALTPDAHQPPQRNSWQTDGPLNRRGRRALTSEQHFGSYISLTMTLAVLVALTVTALIVTERSNPPPPSPATPAFECCGENNRVGLLHSKPVACKGVGGVGPSSANAEREAGKDEEDGAARISRPWGSYVWQTT
ncbi:unnamed protein product [Pleuronectes platessa]|uniref:Uncharacterized protein n=1 Tax=Pleuronectes platessa TaxID=8262 RepID=A0A9N7V708_PLEPL|nr:unnamed protein product [Pleuronectes platessa]